MATYNILLNRFNSSSAYDSLLPRNSIYNTTDPTTATVGIVGQFYVNTSAPALFYCSAVSGSTYTWQPVTSGLLPEIVVTVTTGSTVTCTDGTTTLTGTSTGTVTFIVPNFGTWTVSATLSGQTASGTVVVDTVRNYTITLQYVSTTLNDNTWAVIQAQAQASTGSNYWAVGDAKQITLSGTIGSTNVSGSYWVYILGFNHNASVEGNNRIHFGFGRTAQTYSATNGIALTDSTYGSLTSATGAYTMNTTNVKTGGWSSSHMRQTILQASGTPASPTANTFLSVLPSDLREIMISCSKWSDNTGGGGGSVSSYVTATTDYTWLLAEWEIFGATSAANTYEASHQKQYQYYISGNTKVKYQSMATTSAAYWWERSVDASSSNGFCSVNTDGSPSGGAASRSYGLAPAFCVG